MPLQLPDENVEYQFARLLAQPPDAWTPTASRRRRWTR